MSSQKRYRIVVPLEHGREFVLDSPKPANELTLAEIDELTAVLMRQVRGRGQA